MRRIPLVRAYLRFMHPPERDDDPALIAPPPPREDAAAPVDRKSRPGRSSGHGPPGLTARRPRPRTPPEPPEATPDMGEAPGSMSSRGLGDSA